MSKPRESARIRKSRHFAASARQRRQLWLSRKVLQASVDRAWSEYAKAKETLS